MCRGSSEDAGMLDLRQLQLMIKQSASGNPWALYCYQAQLARLSTQPTHHSILYCLHLIRIKLSVTYFTRVCMLIAHYYCQSFVLSAVQNSSCSRTSSCHTRDPAYSTSKWGRVSMATMPARRRNSGRRSNVK